MKKFVTICVLGAALVGLSACAKMRGDANYGYETQAPYSDARTAGGGKVRSADPVFQSHQHK